MMTRIAMLVGGAAVAAAGLTTRQAEADGGHDIQNECCQVADRLDRIHALLRCQSGRWHKKSGDDRRDYKDFLIQFFHFVCFVCN